MKRSAGESSTGGELDEVSIPGARLTGLRTMIGGPRTLHTTTMFSIFDEEVEEWPLRPLPARVGPGRRGEWGSERAASMQSLRSGDSSVRTSLGRSRPMI